MTPAPPLQVTTPAPKARDLAQQNTDFTAEGAPPPGMVGSTPPETPDEVMPTAPDGDTRTQHKPGPLQESARGPAALALRGWPWN